MSYRIEWTVTERNDLFDDDLNPVVLAWAGISDRLTPKGESNIVLYGHGVTAEAALADLETQKSALVRALG